MTRSRWRRLLRWFLISSVVLGAVGLATLIVWGLPAILTQHPHLTMAPDRYKAITDTRTGLVAAVVAAGAAGGLAYTARTYRLSREGQFTDRYSKAVEQLGHKELEVRLGGIYALERLMATANEISPRFLRFLPPGCEKRRPRCHQCQTRSQLTYKQC